MRGLGLVNRIGFLRHLHRMPTRTKYNDRVMDHYYNPRNVGSLNTADNDVGTGLVGAPACGDVMKLQIRVDSDGKITDAKFKTFGCGSTIASSSYATETIIGKEINKAKQIKNKEIASYLKLPQ